MKIDYYHVLKVPRSATAEEIKAAYRKLAIEHHPDKTGGDVQSAQIFKEVSEAYETLGDLSKRQAYDDAQSRAPVSNLNETIVPVVEDYFSQFVTHPN
jgi:DnaJ-class molecular chaperone